jgi:Tfp pilus assembly pilus retraction ATPase PilT
VEVLLNSPLISDLIFKGEIHSIKEIMKKSKELGMQTFDMACSTFSRKAHQLRRCVALCRFDERSAPDDQQAECATWQLHAADIFALHI